MHASLDLHAGPDWDVPEWAGRLYPGATALRLRAWLNYMAQCAGIGSRELCAYFAAMLVTDRRRSAWMRMRWYAQGRCPFSARRVRRTNRV